MSDYTHTATTSSTDPFFGVTRKAIPLPKGTIALPSNMPDFEQSSCSILPAVKVNFGTQTHESFKDIFTNYVEGFLDSFVERALLPQECPDCHCALVGNGEEPPINLLHIPFGGQYTKVGVHRVRVRCPKCGRTFIARIPFQARGHRITTALKAFCEDLLHYGYTLKQVHLNTGVSMAAVKDIHMEMLRRKYTVNGEGKELNKPEQQARYLGIDEFLLHEGRKFAVIIIDLETGHILHLAHGKKKSTVYEFIDRVGEEWMKGVEAVACDMNSDFEEAFKERCPHIDIVYDHFHIVSNFNKKVVSEVRKDEQKRLIDEGREEEAKQLKGTKYILTSKRSTLERKDQEAKEGKIISKGNVLFNKREVTQKGGNVNRYDELLKDNALLATLDIVKENLDIAYTRQTVEAMGADIDGIIKVCEDSGNRHMQWFARLLSNHRDGIVGYAKHHISTGKVEGTNAKIKAIRSTRYGVADDEYFFLMLMDASRK